LKDVVIEKILIKKLTKAKKITTKRIKIKFESKKPKNDET